MFTARERELLDRHSPVLRYDVQDDMRAMGIASAVTPGNLLRRSDGEVVAGRADDGQVAELTLELMGTYAGPLGDDHLVLAEDVPRTARALQRRPELADRVYGHVVEHGGRTWLQYWLWLYDNPRNLFGLGAHQGDWEMVQVGLDRDDQPVVATCSQHSFGEPRRWEAVERDGDHPVVYVAVLSHALYFSAGTHVYPTGIDHAYDHGPEARPRVEEPGQWVSWPGRWGEPVVLGGRFGAPPESPGCQEQRWETPGRFHRRSWWRAPLRAAARVFHALGSLTYPREPQISARRRLEEVDVQLDLRPGGRLRGGRHAYLTIHDATGDHVLASRRIRRPGRRVSTTIRVPGLPDAALVRASAFNRLRQRSDVTEAQV